MGSFPDAETHSGSNAPTGSGNAMNLFEVAREIANRLTRIFLRDETGRRPVFGGAEKFQSDPYWQDHLLFYEYSTATTAPALAPVTRQDGPVSWRR